MGNITIDPDTVDPRFAELPKKAPAETYRETPIRVPSDPAEPFDLGGRGLHFAQLLQPCRTPWCFARARDESRAYPGARERLNKAAIRARRAAACSAHRPAATALGVVDTRAEAPRG